MYRKYLKQLENWYRDPSKKPLLIWGARQVGKTYLIKDLFAESFFADKYLRIDCSEDYKFTDFVFEHPNLDEVLDYIHFYYNFPTDKEHLLIFDEVQECLPIVKLLKHFCERRRDIPVIATGSLVRIKIFRETHKRGSASSLNKFLFPVGKINQVNIFPMTFDEFLYNLDQNKYEFVKEHFEKKIEINPLMHQELLNIFYKYMFVGGMPEVVETFINNQDQGSNVYNIIYSKIKEIYDDYLADMDLYQASPESILRSRLIYKDIYNQLNKENKNFKFSAIEEGKRSRDMISSIGWLIMSKVVNQSFLLKERITLPLIKEDNSLMRLYLSDIGMFTYQSGVNAKTFVTDKNNVLSGIYFETYVAQELVANGFELFYWKGKRSSEFEFVINDGEKIIPIDVKKGRSRLNSIEEYRVHNKKDVVIKISSNQYGFDKDNLLLTVPFYYVPLLLKAIKNNEFSYF